MNLGERIRMSELALTLWPPSVEEVLRRFEKANEILLDRVSIGCSEIKPDTFFLLDMPVVKEIIPEMMKTGEMVWFPDKEVVSKPCDDCHVYVVLEELSAIQYTSPVTRMVKAGLMVRNRERMSIALFDRSFSADLRAFQNSQILIRRKPRKNFWDEERVRVRVGELFYSSPAGSD